MKLFMEELEERRTFPATPARQFSLTAGSVTNAKVAPKVMPLRHDTKIRLRRPPKGYGKWLTAIFSVRSAPRRLVRRWQG